MDKFQLKRVIHRKNSIPPFQWSINHFAGYVPNIILNEESSTSEEKREQSVQLKYLIDLNTHRNACNY